MEKSLAAKAVLAEGTAMRPDVDWPEELRRDYAARGFWTGRHLGVAFFAAVDEHATRIAVVDGERRVSYAELGRLVAGAASRLRDAGLEGETVLFQLPNSLELVVAYFACVVAGAIPIATQPAHREAEIAHFATTAKAAGWFVPKTHRDHDYGPLVENVLRRCPSLRKVFVLGGETQSAQVRAFSELMVASDSRPAARGQPRDVAMLQLSGGSTGMAKLIPRTHDDYLYNSLACARATDVDRDTVLLTPLPLMHNFSLACPGIQAVLLLGGRVVVAPSPSPAVVWPLVAAEAVTWIPAVPATLISWLDRGLQAPMVASVRSIYVGGQRLNPEPARRARAVFGDAVQQIYGMAEGLLCCTRRGDSEEVVVLTQGRPVSIADELRVVDEQGIQVAPGEVGELETRGPYTIRGYQNAAALNPTMFTADGFYRTGDLVRMHPSGNVIVEGRRKDVINRGGEKISAGELEQLIVRHPQISNAAVVAYPDAVLGERVCAFVTLKDGALELAELVAYLLEVERISPGTVPERLFVRDVLPLTAVGKISKGELREEARRLARDEETG